MSRSACQIKLIKSTRQTLYCLGTDGLKPGHPSTVYMLTRCDSERVREIQRERVTSNSSILGQAIDQRWKGSPGVILCPAGRSEWEEWEGADNTL